MGEAITDLQVSELESMVDEYWNTFVKSGDVVMNAEQLILSTFSDAKPGDTLASILSRNN